MITFWRVEKSIISFSGPREEVLDVKRTIKALPGKGRVWTWGHIPMIGRHNGGAILPEYLTAFLPEIGEEWRSPGFEILPPPPYSDPPPSCSTEGDECESVRAQELPEFTQGEPGEISKDWTVRCQRCHIPRLSHHPRKAELEKQLMEEGWRKIARRWPEEPLRWACPQCLGILRVEFRAWRKTR